MMQTTESKLPFYEMYLGSKFLINESEKKKDPNEDLKKIEGYNTNKAVIHTYLKQCQRCRQNPEGRQAPVYSGFPLVSWIINIIFGEY